MTYFCSHRTQFILVRTMYCGLAARVWNSFNNSWFSQGQELSLIQFIFLANLTERNDEERDREYLRI